LQIRFLADPSAGFTKALELDFDGTAIFGGSRSQRYALKIEDGKVTKTFIEPDGTGADGTCCRPTCEMKSSCVTWP
jgi:2-Cys peroxiredoxin 5